MTQYTVHNLAQHPELQESVDDLARVWDEFMLHDGVADEHFGRLYDWFADYQTALCDAEGEVIARALCVPIYWDEREPLPDGGWDWALQNSVDTYTKGIQPNAVSAIEITIAPHLKGAGLSSIALKAMRENAQSKGFSKLVAPVRPNMKHLYPLTPMARYITWSHDATGAPFDSWLRVHWRLGARIMRIAPLSMRITGTIADWEQWTGMRFFESGEHIIKGALNPVMIHLEADEGVYIEPNVWMLHQL